MGLHKGYDDQSSIDHHHIDSLDDLTHKKDIRQRLENRLEGKRLKEELEFFDGELDGEFDWDCMNKP